MRLSNVRDALLGVVMLAATFIVTQSFLSVMVRKGSLAYWIVPLLTVAAVGFWFYSSGDLDEEDAIEDEEAAEMAARRRGAGQG